MKKCKVCGISENDTKIYNGEKFGYDFICRKHYLQLSRHGKIYARTIYDPNEFIKYEDYYEIRLYNKNCEHTSSAYIDIEDYEKVKNLKWYEKKNLGNSKSYCVTKQLNKNSPISIQDVIFNNLDDGYHPINKYDHIDNNGLNNRKYNLRLVNSQQNAMNMSMKTTNTSGVVGVRKYTPDTHLKWDATMTYKYKNIWFGRSESFDEAVKMRIVGESKYFKEYSNNYNPSTNTIQLTYLSHDDNLKTFIEADLDGNLIEFKKIK